ncbi:D-alanyl-D-alanine carboxypeptidase family protein [Telmatospirillum siberiense]|uniref:serine-type D-Ala-D-Ala carboxypeptidase n=1 Tax=Telmatospirillum siberiense TaxID=382514 RepID=A0A2N3PS22_9PROT|nr:D-alanyl-D-alanine carboxypeptidase family protein [Telmatospirillum siberiense]PKU23210.1 D-alanyl-D-alanine carboxypeptidase [Telmatospirillum siberiense]
MRSYTRFGIAAGAAFAFFLPFGTVAEAETIDTQARQAIIVDANTGTILMEKNADDLMTPSSMSKLMTVYMVFERLKEGSLKMTDELPVSETAWKKNYKSEGSLMFLPVHSMVKVSDLLRGVIIQSGNDACSVLAEGLAGSEEAFAERETRKSREIGLTKSTFKNASGWPVPGHQMTARDLSVLARRLILDFPDYYPIFGEKSFVFNNIKQDNRNPLIWQNIAGADGLKTGHTEDGGYGEVGSAIRDGRRVIVVLNGMTSIKMRAEESERLIEWAFREFDDYKLFKAGETVTDGEVWLGVEKSVPLTVAKDVLITLPRTARHDMKVSANFNGPLPAPVKKGTEVGVVTITAPGIQPVQVPLLAGADVERLGFFGRIGAAVKRTLWGA